MARHGVCAPPPLQPGRCSSDRLGAQAATTYGKGLVGRLADQRLFGRRAARLTQAEEVNAKSKSVCKRRHESVLLSSTGTSHAGRGRVAVRDRAAEASHQSVSQVPRELTHGTHAGRVLHAASAAR